MNCYAFLKLFFKIDVVGPNWFYWLHNCSNCLIIAVCWWASCIGWLGRVGDSSQRDFRTNRLHGKEFGGGLRSVCKQRNGWESYGEAQGEDRTQVGTRREWDGRDGWMDGRVGTSPSLLTFPPLFLSCIFILFCILILHWVKLLNLCSTCTLGIFVYSLFIFNGWLEGRWLLYFKFNIIFSSEALNPTHILWKMAWHITFVLILDWKIHFWLTWY